MLFLELHQTTCLMQQFVHLVHPVIRHLQEAHQAVHVLFALLVSIRQADLHALIVQLELGVQQLVCRLLRVQELAL
jgi:hypothetical protein